jgi:hypothetical protein
MEWSWVDTLAEVEEARARAGQIVGLELAAVRYCALDYAQLDRPHGIHGPRNVTAEDEWRDPSWRFAFGDSVDHGVESEMAGGTRFTVSWDSPGWHEGIWIRQVPMIGSAVMPEGNVAIWDVSRGGRWDQFLGHNVSDVQLAYKPWAPNEGYWCSRIALTIQGSDIELLLGEGAVDNELHRSADNIAVLFPPAVLPDWERGE